VYLQGQGVPRDPARASIAFEKACSAGIGAACSDLGLMHYTGDGVPLDKAKGLGYLKRACDVGYKVACQWYAEAQARDAAQPPAPVEK
jgi:TPR repeat protein